MGRYVLVFVDMAILFKRLANLTVYPSLVQIYVPLGVAERCFRIPRLRSIISVSRHLCVAPTTICHFVICIQLDSHQLLPGNRYWALKMLTSMFQCFWRSLAAVVLVCVAD